MTDYSEYSSEQKAAAKKSDSSSISSSSATRQRKRPPTQRLKHHIRNFNHVRLALLVAMLFTLLVATMFRTTQIVFMAALLFSVQFIATIAARFLGQGLAISRSIPEIGYVGDTIQGHVSVQNNARIPAFLVHVEPGEMETGKSDAKAPGSTHNGIQGTADSISRIPLSLIGNNELLLPILRPAESAEWHPRWRLGRRGVWDVPPAQIGARDPLGLFTSSTRSTEPHTILVLPRPVPLERVDFRGGESQTHTPQYSSIAVDAFDFHGIRAWQAGEAIRRVHWKSTARTGELHVVEWEEDFGSDLCILLDMRATRRFSKNEGAADDALEIMITLAASVTAHLINSGHAVRLFCWQENEAGEAELSKHEARSGRDLVEALKWMAQLQSLAPLRQSKTSAAQNSHADFLGDSNHPISLSQLAQTTAPHLQSARSNGDAILILCSVEADYATATSTLSRAVAQLKTPTVIAQLKTPTVIAVDSDSFLATESFEHSKPRNKSKRDRVKQYAPSGSPQSKNHSPKKSRDNTSQREEFFSAGRVRILRRGQSLSAVLEQ